MKQRELPSRVKTAIFSLFVLALLGLGGANLRENFALRGSRHVAHAQIIDSRVQYTKFGKSYEIQYSFEPSPDAPSLRRMGWFSDNLWSTLPEEEWQKALSSGEVEVRFDPANQRNNAPTIALPSLIDDSVPVLLGLFLAACIVVAEVKRSRSVGTAVLVKPAA